ncbi:MAG: hypothetical protein WC750_01755 [Patescibacteria group bacterium]|jgi:cytidine deaminase
MPITLEQEQKLIAAAQEGVKNALTVKGSQDDNRYGAAVLTDKGNIYGSGQYFSDTHSLTLHAEQSVLAHAAAHGEYAIEAIAISWNKPAGRGEGSVYPCHMCKQVLWESYLRSKLNMLIIIANEDGKVVEKLNLLDIMNYTWP